MQRKPTSRKSMRSRVRFMSHWPIFSPMQRLGVSTKWEGTSAAYPGALTRKASEWVLLCSAMSTMGKIWYLWLSTMDTKWVFLSSPSFVERKSRERSLVRMSGIIQAWLSLTTSLASSLVLSHNWFPIWRSAAESPWLHLRWRVIPLVSLLLQMWGHLVSLLQQHPCALLYKPYPSSVLVRLRNDPLSIQRAAKSHQLTYVPP